MVDIVFEFTWSPTIGSRCSHGPRYARKWNCSCSRWYSQQPARRVIGIIRYAIRRECDYASAGLGCNPCIMGGKPWRVHGHRVWRDIST